MDLKNWTPGADNRCHKIDLIGLICVGQWTMSTNPCGVTSRVPLPRCLDVLPLIPVTPSLSFAIRRIANGAALDLIPPVMEGRANDRSPEMI